MPCWRGVSQSVSVSALRGHGAGFPREDKSLRAHTCLGSRWQARGGIFWYLNSRMPLVRSLTGSSGFLRDDFSAAALLRCALLPPSCGEPWGRGHRRGPAVAGLLEVWGVKPGVSSAPVLGGIGHLQTLPAGRDPAWQQPRRELSVFPSSQPPALAQTGGLLLRWGPAVSRRGWWEEDCGKMVQSRVGQVAGVRWRPGAGELVPAGASPAAEHLEGLGPVVERRGGRSGGSLHPAPRCC